jgi:hypothetical protein
VHWHVVYRTYSTVRHVTPPYSKRVIVSFRSRYQPIPQSAQTHVRASLQKLFVISITTTVCLWRS